MNNTLQKKTIFSSKTGWPGLNNIIFELLETI